jgi:hypothetical protein
VSIQAGVRHRTRATLRTPMALPPGMVLWRNRDRAI